MSSNSEKTKVNVVMSVYNHEQFLRKSIESVLNQETTFKYQILIHDDASTDGSTEIINEYKKRHPDKIKSILQKENQFQKGKYHIEDFVIPFVTGDYVAFLEGDDFWCDKHKLQLRYDALETHPECAMSVHKTRFADVDDNLLKEVMGEGLFKEGIISSEEIFDTYFIKGEWPFHTSSLFLRATFFLERPYFWEKFYVGDLPTLMWAAHRGSFYFVDRILSCYRRFVPGSATIMNRVASFQLHKAKTNAEGLLAFNDVTKGRYWKYIKHHTYYYIYQYYKGSGKIVDEKRLIEAKKNLRISEKIRLRLKYTKGGFFVRNMLETMKKYQLRKV